MWKSRPEQRLSFKAAGAIKRARAVKFDANGNVVQAAASADKAFGVADDAAEKDARVDVVVVGVGRAVAASNIAAGTLCAAAADGKVAVGANGKPVVGQALEKAVAGDEFNILIVPSQI